MRRLSTRYEVKIRFMAWGDLFDPAEMVAVMDLEPGWFTARRKGEVMHRPSGESYTSKTGMLSALAKSDGIEFEPERQFAYLTARLARLPGDFKKVYKVQRAELQVYVYHDECRAVGEWDFTIPDDCMAALCERGIQLNLTVMP